MELTQSTRFSRASRRITCVLESGSPVQSWLKQRISRPLNIQSFAVDAAAKIATSKGKGGFHFSTWPDIGRRAAAECTHETWNGEDYLEGGAKQHIPACARNTPSNNQHAAESQADDRSAQRR